MPYRDIRTGVMITICNDWISNSAIFERYLVTSVIVSVLMESKEALTDSVKERERTTEKTKNEKAQLLIIDDEFDTCARVLHTGAKTVMLASPAKIEKLQKAIDLIFPKGLSIINTSFANEAGECERIVKKVNRNPDVLEILQSSTLDGNSLFHWYERMINAGDAMTPILSSMNTKEENAELFKMESVARKEWVSMVATIKRMAKLANWSEEDYDRIFDPADELAKQAGPKAITEQEEPKTTTEQEDSKATTEQEDSKTTTEQEDHDPDPETPESTE